MPHASHEDFSLEDVILRLATPADYATIGALFRESLLDGQLRDNDTGADIDNLEEGYFSDEGASAFWVATFGEQIIGMIGVQRTGDGIAEVRRMRVRKPYRRRGIGTLLMQHAIEFCREHDYLKVVLDVRVERGPAIALFEKFGFTHTRTRDIGNRRTMEFYIDLYSEPKT
jgi:ribosomal protein S18 acetylase RimI-like enzyme